MVRAVAREGAEPGEDRAPAAAGGGTPESGSGARAGARAPVPERTRFAEPPASAPVARPRATAASSERVAAPGTARDDAGPARATTMLAPEPVADDDVPSRTAPARPQAPTVDPGTEPADPSSPSRSRAFGPVGWVVVAAVVVQMAPRLWGAIGGWFFADDFWRQDLTTRMPLGELAFSGLGGHLSPLMWAVLYPFTTATLWNWTPHVVFMVCLWLLIDLLVLLLFRRLWGWGWPTGVAFALFAVSGLTAPSFLWSGQVWLGGLTVLGLALMLLTVARAVERPTFVRAAVAWLALIASVLLSERNALEAGFVGLFAIVAFAPVHGGVRAFLRRTWLLYAGSALLLAAYAVFYVATLSRGIADPLFSVTPTSGALLDRIVAGLGQSVAPGVLGGPWFTDGQAVISRAEVPGLWAFLAVEALLAILVAVVVVRRRGLAAVLLLVVVILANLALIAVARSAFTGNFAMQDFRYYANLALWAPMLVTLALVPALARPTESGPARYPSVIRRSVARHPVVWAALALVVLNGSLVSTVASAQQFRSSQARPFLERTLADLAQLGPVTIADRQLPSAVVPALLTSQTLASRVLSAAEPRPDFSSPTPVLHVIADDGSVVPARIDGGSVTRPGPDGDCGTAIQRRDTQKLTLANPLFAWPWWSRVDYLAQADDSVRIKAGDGIVTVPVSRGSGSVYVPLSGAIDDIFVTAGSNAGVCIAGIHVGSAVPDVPTQG